MKIFALCSDYDLPLGGSKKLYRHVDILNDHGFSAFIMHEKTGFRCTWFRNSTKIVYKSEIERKKELPDYLILPEAYATPGMSLPQGVKKVVFNQNCYYTFDFFGLDKDDLRAGYLDPEVLATMVVSDDSVNYMKHSFPNHPVYRIHNAIDSSVFTYQVEKKPQIAFMLRKNPNDVLQVINILKYRGMLEGYTLAPIQDQVESEVAAILKESAIFLSFGYPEGFSLSPAEAMACGCIVAGFHGRGGAEYFKEEFCYPVPQGDVLALAKTAERVIQLRRENPKLIEEQTRKAAAYIRDHYSPEQEVKDIVSIWKTLTGQA